ncbi:MAG: hypothetical protein AB1742_08510 [bacterium]
MTPKVIRRRYKDQPPIDRFDLSWVVPGAAAAALKDEGLAPFLIAPEMRLGALTLPYAGTTARRVAFEQFFKLFRVSEDEAPDWNSRTTAKWYASLYPGRKYRAVVAGPPLGAAASLSALLRAPFLCANYCFPLIKQGPVDPEDVKSQKEFGQKTANLFLKRDDGVTVVCEHDPIHNRLRARHTTFLRFKFNDFPPAYQRFASENLEKDGMIVCCDVRVGWRQYRGVQGYYFQVGAPGGIEDEEYLRGSRRISKFLEKYLLEGKFQYRLAEPFEMLPESRFGMLPSFKESARLFARNAGKPFLHVVCEDAYTLSRLAAALFVRASRREGKRPANILIHSGAFVHPSPCFESNTIPLWVPDASYRSWRFAGEVLDAYRFKLENVLLAFEPSLADPPDVFSLERWKSLVGRRGAVKLIATNQRTYPVNTDAYARFWKSLKSWSRRNSDPVDMWTEEKDLLEELDRLGIIHSVERPSAG